jgi:UDP-N-acetylglucosamine--N-acetylmuramyl-(pentapeptide) pyrophosphoryl-undecaprenol N-acetylglucosamine transferase
VATELQTEKRKTQIANRKSQTGAPARSNDFSRSEARATEVATTNQVELRYVGEAGGIEESLAQAAGIPFSPVTTGQLRGRAPWVMARSLIRMARGAEQCARVLDEFRPDAVFITGGYVTAPVAWAAWRRRIPLLIYLPDAEPGLAIRATSRLATAVAVSFDEAARWFPGKAVVTGYPVRPELLAADKAASRAALGLSANLPVLLVFGGSRGAHSINQALVAALPQLLPHSQIVHITGHLDWPMVADGEWQMANGKLQTANHATRNTQYAIRITHHASRYHPYPYLHAEMIHALAAADLVVARAGASTLGEFPAVGLPSVLVPYPYAGQHQEVNAAYLAERGAAVVLADRDLDSDLASIVLQLFSAPERLASMARAARSLARPDAAAHIAAELRRLVN